MLDLPAETEKKLKKPVERMSETELRSVVSELGEVITSMGRELEEAKKADPFWYFQPSTGEITPESRQILLEYLKPEDIPQRLDGQIDVLSSKANINLISGGNQSGKTTSCVIRNFIRACRVVPLALKGVFPEEIIPKKKYNRFRVVCEDYTHGFLNHNLPVYKSWVPREFLIDGRWEKSYSDKKDTLTLVDPKEKTICAHMEFMTNQADVQTFQGPPLDGITYDEEPRKDIYDENLLRFVTSDRLDVMFGMTPTQGLTWVYDDIFENEGANRNGKSIACFQLSSLGNPKANLKTLREILDRIKIYDHLRMRLMGAWISLSGLIYGALFRRKDHVVDPAKLVKGGGYLECNCPHVRERGADPHSSTHLPGCPYLAWLVFRGLDPHLVKETAGVFMGLDREGTHVVDRCYWSKSNTVKIKSDMRDLAKNYRMAWSRCDPSADSDLTALDNRNIWKELTTGDNRIPNMRKADKYQGSIKAGVDVIMRLLEINPATGKPGILVMDRPENQMLITAFRTLQRETFANEDKKGIKDAIAEGKHDMHAALRYISQSRLFWRPHEPTSMMTPQVPEMEETY